jgi:hypothetical protein
LDNKVLERLKEEYWSIYEIEVDGVKFIYRELSRGEYSKVLRMYDDDLSREEYICRICVIEPVGFDFADDSNAGIASSLSQSILEESGFSVVPTGKLDRILNSYREEMNNFQNQVSCIIQEAFPTLSLEEIEMWPMEKTLWYYSRAEFKLRVLRGIPMPGDQQDTGDNSSGNMEDFPELAAEEAFMKGKMR